tara:strand:- start:2272 stop:2889 length:618 start_codon:yes stop_codon:yes gene_type:complete
MLAMEALEIERPEGLRRAGREDSALLGAITADAFRDDPFNHWTFGNETAMRHTFTSYARHVYTPRGYSCLAGDGAVAMWLGPGGDKELPFHAMPGLAAALLASGGPRALIRGMAADAALAAHKPQMPHVYLFTIAVRPALQGQGYGRRLMQPVLKACDRARLPAYLESSNPANLGFYGSLGFKVIGEIQIAPGAPPMTPMWRDAR